MHMAEGSKNLMVVIIDMLAFPRDEVTACFYMLCTLTALSQHLKTVK